MPRLQCELICESNAESLNQVYGGFGLLERAGLLKLSFSRAARFKTGFANKALLSVVVEGHRVFYDLRDGSEIDEERLSWCELYFKRSFSTTQTCLNEFGHKIRPLGLNCPVYGPGDGAFVRFLWSLGAARDIASLKALALQGARTSGIVSRLFRMNGGRWNADATRMSSMPVRTTHGTSLFLTRLWDPARNKRDEAVREAMNEMRVSWIRAMREHFGPAFVGGVVAEEFSRRRYPDVVVSDQITRKGAFFDLLASTDVCITTTGLQGSIGWKLAEYVTHAKAIVTEPLQYGVPGHFADGTHYVASADASACVAATEALLADNERRWQMQDENLVYYLRYLRPDMLVLNTLMEPLAACAQASTLLQLVAT